MTYTLNFISKFGLWELQINRFRARFYRTRDAAMKCVTRYRSRCFPVSSRISPTTEHERKRERDSFA